MTTLSDTQRVILSKAAQHQALLATPPAKLPAAARNAVLRSLMSKGLLEEVSAPRDFVDLGWRQDVEGTWIALVITAAGMSAMGLEAPRSPQAVDEEVVPDDAGLPARDATSSTDLPTAPQGDSQAAFLSPPLSAASETSERPQQPPVSHQAPNGRPAALRMAAATVLAAWDAPKQTGINDAIAALRDALTSSPRASGAAFPPRTPRTGTKQEAVLNLLLRDEGATITQVMDATGWQQHTVRGFLAGLKRRGIMVEVLERVRQIGPNKQGAKGSYSIYRIAIAIATPAEAG